MPTIVAIDVEANGLIEKDISDPLYQPAIIEFGAIKSPWGKLSQLINPECQITPKVTEITGITNEDVKGEPTFPLAFNSIAEFMTGCDVLITFNGLGYDLPVIMFTLQKYSLQYRFPWPRYNIDLMVAATDFLNLQGKTGNKPPKLVELHMALFGKEYDAHRAFNDAEATLNCAIALMEKGVIKL